MFLIKIGLKSLSGSNCLSLMREAKTNQMCMTSFLNAVLCFPFFQDDVVKVVSILEDMNARSDYQKRRQNGSPYRIYHVHQVSSWQVADFWTF